MSGKSHEEIWDEFRDLVNLAPKEIEDFLETEESKSVGDTGGDGKSTGHKSSKRIIEIKISRRVNGITWQGRGLHQASQGARRPRG